MGRGDPRGDLGLAASSVIGVDVAAEAGPAAELRVSCADDRLLAGEPSHIGGGDASRAGAQPRDAVAGVCDDARLKLGIHSSTLTPASDSPSPYTPPPGQTPPARGGLILHNLVKRGVVHRVGDAVGGIYRAGGAWGMAIEQAVLTGHATSSSRELACAHMVRSRADLLMNGWTDRSIAAAVGRKQMYHLRRGWYIDAEEYRALTPERQHLVQIIAVARDGHGGAAMSHISAGVLWRLPFYRVPLARVHMTTDAPRRISSAPDVLRHIAPLPPEDLVVIDGIRCTSLARTVFDLVRGLPLEGAVSVADAAERMMGIRIREWDLNAIAAWRAEIERRLDGAWGARGIRQARWVAEFADGRAQLPGESVSRLQLHRLGFPPPDLQVLVPGPRGKEYFVDFGFDHAKAFGEFDGKGKYTDAALRSGRSIDEVLLDEKEREDWIRGSTGRRFARWGFEHIRTPEALASRLAAFGITPH